MLVASLVCLACSGRALAQPVAEAVATAEPNTPTTDNGLGFAALAFATPMALQTGLANGVAVAVSSAGQLRYGAALAWTVADEWSPSWAVTHHEFRGRATVTVDHRVGAGRLLAQAGAGVAVVRESRIRHQSWRTEGGKQERTAWGVLPLVTAEVGVGLCLAGDWGLVVLAGPAWPNGDANLGWVSHVGLGWLP